MDWCYRNPGRRSSFFDLIPWQYLEDHHIYSPHDMRSQMQIACLVSMPYKCGPGYDSADEQIISKINWLKLSKDESKERVLKAIQEDDEEFEALKRKKSLDEHEEFRLSVRGDVRKYQERLLSIIDHME